MDESILTDKKLCDCGCGELIPIINKLRRPARFKYGHNNRGRKYPIGFYKKGVEARNWRGGRYINEFGYFMVYNPEHPRSHHGYVREHIMIMEKHIGRPILRNEEIHHKNGNRQDNRIENLVLMPRLTHHNITNLNQQRDHYGRFKAKRQRFVFDYEKVWP
jgi:HNH endonuclease